MQTSPESTSRTGAGDGLDVTLWWSPADDAVSIEVLHLA